MTLESIVNSLVALGYSKELAETEARRQLSLGPPASTTSPADEAGLEREEQRKITELFRAYRFKVYTTSQYRPAKVSPGIPDLWCIHETQPLAFWWESKRLKGGEFSTAQEDFRDECQRCRIGWGGGNRYAAAAYLVQIGLAEDNGDGRIEPVRRSA